MKKLKNILIIISVLIGIMGFSTRSYADCSTDPIDYECWCEETSVVSKISLWGNGLQHYVTNYADYGIAIDSTNHIICFQNEEIIIGENTELTIPSKHLIFYGINYNFDGNYSITTNGNISLVNTTLSGSSSLPLSIHGSTVNVIDSTITSASIGIFAVGQIGTIKNISVEGTTITGPGSSTSGSIGVKLQNTSSVTISDENTLTAFETGISGESYTTNLIYSNLETPINNSGSFVDITKVGIVLDDETATRVAGAAPIESCSSVDAENGFVEMYMNNSVNSEYTLGATCTVKVLTTDEDLCLYTGDGDVPETDEEKAACVSAGECTCYEGSDCIFDCEDVSIPAFYRVAFVYTDSATYEVTEPKVLEEMSQITIATGAPGVTIGTGEEGDQPLTGGDDGGSGITVEGDDGGDGSSPLGGVGVKSGCTLSRASVAANPAATILAELLVLIALISTPIAVKIRIKRKK